LGKGIKIPHEKIAMRAYEKWCNRGRPGETDRRDWIEAEAELRAELGSNETIARATRSANREAEPALSAQISASNDTGKETVRCEDIRSLARRLRSPKPVIRTKALVALSGIDYTPRLAMEAILGVVASLDDADPDNRAFALRILCRICPEFQEHASGLATQFGTDDREVRLAWIRHIVTILPLVHAALGAHAPGWLALDRLLEQILTPEPAGSSAPGRAEFPIPHRPVTEDPMEIAGRWIAWDRGHKRMIAVADTYADVLRQVTVAGEGEAVVEKAPGIHSSVAERRFTLLEDESPNILDEVKAVCSGFIDPDEWLDTPNTRLWCKRPRELIGTEEEKNIRYLLRGIKNGITT
jgi:hypothetical protein